MATALQTIKIDGIYYAPGDTIPARALAAVRDSLPDGVVDADDKPRGKRGKAPADDAPADAQPSAPADDAPPADAPAEQANPVDA